jgi:DNA-binding protein H-NS
MKKKEDLEREILEEQERFRLEGIEKVKEIIHQYGLDIGDVFPQYAIKTKPIKASTKKVAPKYRNPLSGETWTGRGKEPLWIARKDRNLFLI